MTAIDKIKLAYKVVERLKLLPILGEEIDALYFSLDLVKQEDLEEKPTKQNAINKRELLIDFAKNFTFEGTCYYDSQIKRFVDDYLKQINK
tara:strand:+ start:123 stop:395 length:273 start_codon:yes stop_codon:yes gene_type:complete